MGCGASKGKAEADTEVTEVKFKRIGIRSLDEFFDKC